MRYFLLSFFSFLIITGCGQNSHLSLDNLTPSTPGPVVGESPTVDLDLSAGLVTGASINLAGSCAPNGSTVSIASPDMTPSPVSGVCDNGAFVIATPVVFDGAGPNGLNPVLDATITAPDGSTGQDSDPVDLSTPLPPAVDLDVAAGVPQNAPTNLTGSCSPAGSTISIASPDMTPSPVTGTCDSSGSFTIATPVVFDGAGPNGATPVLATTLTDPSGGTAQDMVTAAFAPVAGITTALLPDGTSNLGLALTDSAGAPLVPGDTIMFTVRDSATGAAIETLAGDYGQPLTGYATDEAVAANSIQSYLTSPGDDITDGGALVFDKLAWAKATGNIGVNKGIELQFDIAATDTSAGTTSVTDSAIIDKGFLKLDGALGMSSTLGSQNPPFNCPSNVRFIAGSTAVSELVDSSTAETSEDGITWVPKPAIFVGDIINFCADAQPGTINNTWGRIALVEPSFAPGSFGGVSYYALQKVETISNSNFYAVRSFILSGNPNNLDVTNTLVDIESQTRTINLNGTTFSDMFIEASPGAGLPAAATFNPPFSNTLGTTQTTTETHDFNGGEGVYHIHTELGGGASFSEQDMYLLLISF